MNDLTPGELDRLESAHQAFSPRDGVAKARLLAALTAEGPPHPHSRWKARFEVMRGNRVRVAAAAVLMMTMVGVWYSTTPRNMFGATLQAMIDAKGFRCDMIEVVPGDGGGENATLGGRLFWAADGAERIETINAGEVREIEIHRPGRSGLILLLNAKKFQVLDQSISREYSFGLFGQLSRFEGKARSRLGAKEIRGRKVEGFTVPWSGVISEETHGNMELSIWLDATTSLPVRVDLTGSVMKDAAVRFENFQWGVQDAKLFDTSIPPDFEPVPKSDVTDERITEYVVFGLSVFAKYNDGKYPAVNYVYGDEQGEALRTLMRMDPKAVGWWAMPDKTPVRSTSKAEEFGYGSAGLSWINLLQRERPECVYHGKTVMSKDVGKILLRWKRDDGRYRVIFGDLRADDVTAERLKELEAR